MLKCTRKRTLEHGTVSSPSFQLRALTFLLTPITAPQHFCNANLVPERFFPVVIHRKQKREHQTREDYEDYDQFLEDQRRKPRRKILILGAVVEHFLFFFCPNR